ncbi:MAG: endonuclease III [bacterium]|nr:endonuclease III [bacterium]
MTGLTKKNRVCLFEAYLDELFENPKCELYYEKDYQLLIAVVLSAQTTDKRVNQVTRILWKKYPSLDSLSQASIDEIASILVPIGTYQKKAVFVSKIAKVLLTNFGGKVPNDPMLLQALPGVGRKTSNVVLSNLFDYPAIAVDTHVERVSKRLRFVLLKDDVLTIEKKLEKLYDRSVWAKRHHQMVLFGRYHCKAIKPDCEHCKIRNICSFK